MIIGLVACPSCGPQNITQPESLRIWYAYDADQQLCEAICPNCSRSIEARLSDHDLANFEAAGVTLLDFGDKFEPLTEALINTWNIKESLDYELV